MSLAGEPGEIWAVQKPRLLKYNLRMIDNHSLEVLATVLFGIAVLHTFLVKKFQQLALKFPEGSIGENFFHLLGEVEIVFGLWAALFCLALAFSSTGKDAIQFVESANFTEPLFVFAVMAVAATKPILDFARTVISGLAKFLPLPGEAAFFLAALTVGPLLGSFITEPAAMTVTALVLKDRFFASRSTDRLKYITIGLLFVNVSIGGVLTPFAAPPVLMVAGTWKWDIAFMLRTFGWKAACAVLINAAIALGLCFKELKAMSKSQRAPRRETTAPLLLQFIHLLFLALIVMTAHHPKVFMGLFLFFIGLTMITKEYQEELKLKESLLVAFFLGGLVVLGGPQRWWLEPLIGKLDILPLFIGATALTAVTDNAALTYLGSQVPNVTEAFKYALVAGAVAGGGLTVIANAPNPAGFAILRDGFGPAGISPARLFLGALLPTIVAMACFWFLPTL